MVEILNGNQKAMKEKFVNDMGYWSEEWQSLLVTDQRFFEACMNFLAVPWKKTALEPKVKELIYIAVDSAPTHLYRPGIKTHIVNALKHGATKEEIMEVLALSSVLGVHSVTTSVPILIDELKKVGIEVDDSEMTERQKELKERYIQQRGYWTELWNDVLLLNEDFFEGFLEISDVPWQHGVLDPKVKEFIYIAIDVSTTHLYEPGIRVHFRNALKYGATKEEIMEVLDLSSNIGVQTCLESVPLLVEALKNHK